MQAACSTDQEYDTIGPTRDTQWVKSQAAQLAALCGLSGLIQSGSRRMMCACKLPGCTVGSSLRAFLPTVGGALWQQEIGSGLQPHVLLNPLEALAAICMCEQTVRLLCTRTPYCQCVRTGCKQY
jgi:hypothetical protein